MYKYAMFIVALAVLGWMPMRAGAQAQVNYSFTGGSAAASVTGAGAGLVTASDFSVNLLNRDNVTSDVFDTFGYNSEPLTANASFTLTRNGSALMDLTQLRYDYITSGNSAPTTYEVRYVPVYQSGAGIETVAATGVYLTPGSGTVNVPVAGPALTNLVSLTLRFYATGASNNGSGSHLSFDNVSATVATPEPSGLAVLSLAAAALTKRRRRRATSTKAFNETLVASSKTA